MSWDLPIPELAERENNFFTSSSPSTIDQKMYYVELQGLIEQIDVEIDMFRGLDTKQILKAIFSHVYDFVIVHNEDYIIFDHYMGIYEDAFDACLFSALCMFLYDTRRLKGSSLRRFIYDHSTEEYNVKGSGSYFDYNKFKREFLDRATDRSSDKILKEDAKLRKYRKRLLSERPVYNHSSEWSAMRKVSEHEWTLYYTLKTADDEIRDTAKRIRNLYHEMYHALRSSIHDTGYIDRLTAAYDKFLNKLKKVEYERVLQLNKFHRAYTQRYDLLRYQPISI